MIAFARPQSARDTNSNAQDLFVAMLPQIKQQAAIAFRGRRPEEREELVHEVIANCYVAYVRLVQLGKQDFAFATPLANYAVRQVLSGRRVGSKLNIRDVMSPANHRVVVEHPDRPDFQWMEALVEDRHAGPADTAAARLDFGGWLRSLPPRRRKIAKLLATGETTKATAERFNVTAGRISQLRQELQNSWRQFQGELAVA